MANSRSSGKKRLFFALWPDESVQQKMFDLALRVQRQYGGRAIPAENIHMTLQFIGDVSQGLLSDLIQAADSICFDPVDLSMSELVYRPRQQMLWLTPAVIPEALSNLHSQLHKVLSKIHGLHLEKRPFLPHITLVRKLEELEEVPLFQPLGWRATGFCLEESELAHKGAIYRVARSWSM